MLQPHAAAQVTFCWCPGATELWQARFVEQGEGGEESSPSGGVMELVVKLLLRVQTNLSSSCCVVANARWAPRHHEGTLVPSAAHDSQQAEVKHRSAPRIKILREAPCLPTAQRRSWRI